MGLYRFLPGAAGGRTCRSRGPRVQPALTPSMTDFSKSPVLSRGLSRDFRLGLPSQRPPIMRFQHSNGVSADPDSQSSCRADCPPYHHMNHQMINLKSGFPRTKSPVWLHTSGILGPLVTPRNKRTEICRFGTPAVEIEASVCSKMPDHGKTLCPTAVFSRSMLRRWRMRASRYWRTTSL